MYLVTGGSGFCGLEIVKYLLSKSEKVRVLDVEPLPEKIEGVEFVQGNILDFESLHHACRGVDRVIHTAAKVPISKAGKEFWRVNVDGTRNVLESAKKNGVEKIVHISSSSVQHSKNNPVSEDGPYHPVGPYARSKMDAEIICRQYIQSGLKVDIIRPRTVLGQGRRGIFDILFAWISEGEPVFIMGKGNNKIQFLHVQDLASCCYLASRHSGSNAFNIGSKSYGTLKEDLQSLLDYADTGSKIVYLPVALTVAGLATLDILRLSPLASWHYLTYYKDAYFTNEKAKRVLQWEPRYGNKEILLSAYESYLQIKKTHPRDVKFGQTHRTALRQGMLAVLKEFFKGKIS